MDSVAIKSRTIAIDGHQVLIPVYKKLFIEQVYVPPMVQRIYMPEAVNNESFAKKLIQELSSSYSAGIVSISQELSLSGITKIKKTNYILSLNQSHEQLSANYRKGHKLNLKNFYQNHIQIEESISIEESVNFYRKFSNPEIPAFYKKAELLHRCMSACFQHNGGLLIQAKDPDNQLIAMAFFSIYNKRLTYHLSCSSPSGKKHNAMYGIIDYVIRNYQNKEMILDFEGSTIPGLALFMSGFGATAENYFSYRWNRNSFLKAIQWMRRKN